MSLIESPQTILHKIEPIDFENDEYLFWDAQGRSVRLILERGTLTNIELAENGMSVQEAFSRYSSRTLGATVNLDGALAEVWARLQAHVKPPSSLSRIVGHAIGSGCLLIVLTAAICILIALGMIMKALFTR